MKTRNVQPKRTCQDFLYQSWPISRIFVGYRTFIQQKQSSKGVLVKRPSESMQHIYRMLQRIFVAKHFCWSRTSAWVFYCKFVAYFQNTFLLEHLWRAAAESDNRRTKMLPRNCQVCWFSSKFHFIFLANDHM